jgi:glycosyltransferase involved in cell wall biosynthesis
MPYRIAFVMEQTLGHKTHAMNFRHWVANDPEVVPTWISIDFEAPDRWERTPVVKDNWTLRASLRAWEQVQAVLRSERLDGLFFHTQVTALFAQRLMKKIPTVISMDATPLNFDTIGGPYQHAPSGFRPVEALKNALNRRVFNHAQKLISWNEWGKQSLLRDYGVRASKVAVIPPGIDVDRWHVTRETSRSGPVRLLFVGGDFKRKGGEVLLTAFRQGLMKDCAVDIVTREDVDTQGLTNVRLHHGLGPNSPELMGLYACADILVLPTLGDSLPMVIMEAMAAGLPVIATSVGAIVEAVEHGVTGLLVPVGDHHALAEATRQLVDNPDLRREMGEAARRAAGRLFSGAQNYRQVLEVCKNCVNAGCA